MKTLLYIATGMVLALLWLGVFAGSIWLFGPAGMLVWFAVSVGGALGFVCSI